MSNKIITAFSLKGGVGRSTTVAALGRIFTNEFGKEVLLVDANMNFGLTQIFFPAGKDSEVVGLEQALLREKKLPILDLGDGLHLAPSSKGMFCYETAAASKKHSRTALSKVLESYRESFDYIFVDVPAYAGILAMNAIGSSDFVLNTVDCCASTLSCLAEAQSSAMCFKHPSSLNGGILLTRVKPERVVDGIIEDTVREGFGEIVFKGIIRDCAAVVQAPFEHKDIWSFDRKSIAAKDYFNVASELMERLKYV